MGVDWRVLGWDGESLSVVAKEKWHFFVFCLAPLRKALTESVPSQVLFSGFGFLPLASGVRLVSCQALSLYCERPIVIDRARDRGGVWDGPSKPKLMEWCRDVRSWGLAPRPLHITMESAI